jgi:hypothetical protein
MASSRIISTNFWKDRYIAELDPTEKLLFLYFLTNPQTTLAGVYEINLREVAFDTGIDRDMVEKILARFCRDEKMWHQDGWVVLRNFVKHQRLNPSIKLGIEKAIADLPAWLQEKLKLLRSNGQLPLDLDTDPPQTGTILSPDTPQKKLKEAKLIKVKEKEAKQNPKPAARSKNLDDELKARERAAMHRPANGDTKSLGQMFRDKQAAKLKGKASGVTPDG